MTDPIAKGRQLMRTLAQPDTEGMTAENARIATADWHGQVKASAYELLNLVEELVEARATRSPAQARMNMAALDVFIYGATVDRLRDLEACWDAVNDEAIEGGPDPIDLPLIPHGPGTLPPFSQAEREAPAVGGQFIRSRGKSSGWDGLTIEDMDKPFSEVFACVDPEGARGAAVASIERASAWRRRFGLVILTAAEFTELRLMARGIGRG
jgi:hypothetical protein